MKARTVILTIEIETPIPLADIRRARIVCLDGAHGTPILASDIGEIAARLSAREVVS